MKKGRSERNRLGETPRRDEAAVVADDATVRAETAVFTEEGAPKTDAAEREEVKLSPKQSRVATASFVFTVLGMIYALASGIFFIVKNWILAPYSYIMLGVMAVYAAVFFIVVGFYAGDAKKGKKKVKQMKKIFGIFRSFTTLVFLVATAVSMAGVIVATGHGLWKWIVVGVNISVAVVQLSLKISVMVFTYMAKKVGKEYTVRVTSYVNGIRKDNEIRSKIAAKLCGTEVTPAEKPKVEETSPSKTVAVNAEQAVSDKKSVQDNQPARKKERIVSVKFDKEQAKAQVAQAVAKVQSAADKLSAKAKKKETLSDDESNRTSR